MKRVLVTGASGFIGRHCAELLTRQGFEVHAAALPGENVSGGEVTWHSADLLDERQPAGLLESVRPTHLLHLAWYAVPGKFWTSPENLRWVSASLRLLHEFTNAGGKRVVAAGTCAEYDWAFPVCSESQTPIKPTTLYGACKNAVRSVIESWSGLHGISWAWGRVFFLYGPFEHPDRLVAYVIRSLLRDEPARCSSGAAIRDFMHVRDVAAGLVALLDSDVQGPVNVASGQGVSIAQLATRIADLVGRKHLLKLGGIPDRPGEPASLVADVRRLREEVGFVPGRTLDEGLAQTIEWWRQSLK